MQKKAKNTELLITFLKNYNADCNWTNAVRHDHYRDWGFAMYDEQSVTSSSSTMESENGDKPSYKYLDGLKVKHKSVSHIAKLEQQLTEQHFPTWQDMWIQ